MTPVPRWDDILSDLGIEGASQMGSELGSPTRRVYLYEDRAYKISLAGGNALEINRMQSLQGEWQLLQQCQPGSWVSKPLEYRLKGDVAVLITGYVDGRRLDELTFDLRTKVVVLSRLVSILLMLSWKGISHNDVLPHNLVVGRNGRLVLLDFDQAMRTTRLHAFYRNFLARANADRKVYGSFLTVVKYLVKQCT